MQEIPRDERTTAIGLARYATEYYYAALGADARIGRWPGYETYAPMPVMFLVAHSDELILKSFLRFRGYTVDQLASRSLGHDLLRLWETATENGLEEFVQAEPIEFATFKFLNELQKKNQLRYIETGTKNFPVFPPLERLNYKLLEAICPVVGFRRWREDE